MIKKTEYITVSKSEYNKLTDELINLREEIANLRKLVFGQKSEKTKYTGKTANGEQLGLFDEVETEANRKALEPKTVVIERHVRKVYGYTGCGTDETRDAALSDIERTYS